MECSTKYYGSEFADLVVCRYHQHCERNGLVYDEPGRHGVETFNDAKGREVVEVRNRWGVCYRGIRDGTTYRTMPA
jgi:hypothetical protein